MLVVAQQKARSAAFSFKMLDHILQHQQVPGSTMYDNTLHNHKAFAHCLANSPVSVDARSSQIKGLEGFQGCLALHG